MFVCIRLGEHTGGMRILVKGWVGPAVWGLRFERLELST